MRLRKHLFRSGFLVLALTPLMSCSNQHALLSLVPAEFLAKLYPTPLVEKLSDGKLAREIVYGRDLFVDTARYIGPEGSVAKHLGNRMNCQNCHLDAGTRFFGGRLTTTYGKFPSYRARDDKLSSLEDRINACISRPHNGKPLPSDSRELRAMMLYIRFLGEGIPMGARQFGDELLELPLIARAASPELGKTVYLKHCQSCHGTNGEGVSTNEKILYPPLWGAGSYAIGSSMHRVRKAAAFIRANMPFGTLWNKPVLSVEEAYDVAAFINDERVNPRPLLDVSKDYPDTREKPVDYPYGPYADNFSEAEHRFGPYAPIVEAQKSSGHQKEIEFPSDGIKSAK